MNASELFRAGRLREAIDAQVPEVRDNPGDQARRVFLFELLAFAGDLERARRQIDAISYDNPGIDLTVQTYRRMLDAEEARRKLFREGVPPKFLDEPPAHVGLRLEAAQRLRQGRPAEARELLQQAAATTPTVAGKLNGKPFTSLADYDELFGTVLEVFAHGDYFWVPLEQVDSLLLNAPRFPRDQLWIPARLDLRSGQAGAVFLPAVYPGSHERADDLVKLGRTNDWNEIADGPTLGVGVHTFVLDSNASGLPDWRELQIA
jgi:type VI secretion system protein ImpE